MRTSSRSRILAVAGLALCSVSFVESQPLGSVDPGSGVMPTLSLEFDTLSPQHGQGGPSTEMSYTLSRIGQSATLYVWAGGPEFRTLCAGGSGDKAPLDAAVTWQAEATLLSYDASGAALNVHWSRIVRDQTLVEGTTIDRHLQLRLGERQRQVLDLLRMPAGIDPTCDGAVITTELTFKEAEPLANSLIEYDVWLVDRDRTGHETIDHVTPRGLQGRAIDYTFRQFSYSAEGVASETGDLSVELHGSVKGRVRPDGRIDLVVGAMRVVQHKGLGTGDGGVKQATLGDGETTEFELPKLPGRLHEVDLRTLLEGQRTAIRVKARRVS